MAGTGRYLDGWTKNWHARWVWCRVWNLSVCNLKVTRIEVLDSSFKGSSTTLSLPNLRWSCSGSKWAHNGLQWCRQGDGAFSLHISTDWQMSCFYVQQHYWIIGEDDIPVRWCQLIVILIYFITFVLVLSSFATHPTFMIHRWRTYVCSRLLPCNQLWSTQWARRDITGCVFGFSAFQIFRSSKSMSELAGGPWQLSDRSVVESDRSEEEGK
jgi:hypothetical protein